MNCAPFVIRHSLLILLWMLVFVLLTVAPGIDHDEKEDQKSDSEEKDHAGTIFPDKLNSIRKLGPIHVWGRYTVGNEK